MDQHLLRLHPDQHAAAHEADAAAESAAVDAAEKSKERDETAIGNMPAMFHLRTVKERESFLDMVNLICVTFIIQ